MPASDGPLLPRRRLGLEFRNIRGKRTLDEVSETTMISTSKLSRLENGQGAPQLRDVRDLISYYDLDKVTADKIRRWAAEGRKQAWWKEYSDVMPGPLDVYLDFESGASVIRSYTPLIIPGLLQTETYAAHILNALPPQKSTEQVRKLVELRTRRQNLLYVKEGPTRLLAVIDETALRRVVGTPEETRAQLDHLSDVSRRKNISIRVIPLGAGAHAGMLGMFTIFQFADDIDRDIVNIETYSGDRYLEEPASVLEYLRTFDSLTHIAQDNEGSRKLLAAITADISN